MSIQVIARVLPKRWGSPARKIVAVKLADVARDDGGKIFPSVETVASEAELSERQVQRILAEFQKDGLLVVVKKGGGRNRPTEYRMCLDVIEKLPDAKPLPEYGEAGNGDMVSPFAPETVTLATGNGDTHVTQPVMIRSIPPSEARSASGEAGADAPSVSAKVWTEGRELLNQSTSKPDPSIIGRWLKQTPSDGGKEKLLALIRAARRAGTGDPVGYVTAALNREYPPPPDPGTFDLASWQRKLTAASPKKSWPAEWGPAPGKRGCRVPSDLITPALLNALSERRIAA